jgi:hypothetical protein
MFDVMVGVLDLEPIDLTFIERLKDFLQEECYCFSSFLEIVYAKTVSDISYQFTGLFLKGLMDGTSLFPVLPNPSAFYLFNNSDVLALKNYFLDLLSVIFCFISHSFSDPDDFIFIKFLKDPGASRDFKYLSTLHKVVPKSPKDSEILQLPEVFNDDCVDAKDLTHYLKSSVFFMGP